MVTKVSAWVAETICPALAAVMHWSGYGLYPWRINRFLQIIISLFIVDWYGTDNCIDTIRWSRYNVCYYDEFIIIIIIIMLHRSQLPASSKDFLFRKWKYHPDIVKWLFRWHLQVVLVVVFYYPEIWFDLIWSPRIRSAPTTMRTQVRSITQYSLAGVEM